MATETTTTHRVARLGNGAALHLVDAQGILCNRWGSTNGTVRAPRFVEGATATCKRCQRLASTTEQPAVEQPAMVTRPCPHCEVRTVTHRAGAVECSEVLCPPCLRDMGKPDPTDTACDCRRSDCGECAPMVRLHAFDGVRSLPRWPGQ